MNNYDAAKILGISGDLDPDTVKRAYRAACKKYHPDINPGGLEMMKAVNVAYDALKDFEGIVTLSETAVDYGSNLNDAINFAMTLPGVVIEVCGTWLWLGGDTRIHKDAIKAFRDGEKEKFRFSGPKMRWYFRPSDYKSYSRGKLSMDEIRKRHGSKTVKPLTNNRLRA